MVHQFATQKARKVPAELDVENYGNEQSQRLTQYKTIFINMDAFLF